MKVTGKRGIGNMLEIILRIWFYIGIIILIALPFALKVFGIRLSSAYIIYPNGIVFLIIMYKFIKLFNSLKNNNPFCENNIKIMRTTGIVALIGSILWIIDFFYELLLVKTENIVTLLSLVFLAILFFGVAIALYILSELFREAVEYKRENELTI